MSAPQTNIEKQQERHKPALTGIRVVLTFAFLLLILLGGYTLWYSNPPEGAETQIDGRTGAVEEVE